MHLPLLRVGALVTALASTPGWTQSEPIRTAELADLSLEQLTRITVTSASRREESLVEAPASLFVITADDIRRSGAVTIPEALRLAPNLQVARADSNQYVIAARGFGNTLSNKLLVLIDGRTVYTPLFSGVFWEAQDTFLPDIDRIEVISGPGATLWGANAVNGVINIITKAASDTQGTYVRAGAGSDDNLAGVRYGGALPNDGHYRAFVKYSDRDAFNAESGPIGDEARMVSGGFRADWRSGIQESTLQADAYRGEVDGGPMRVFTGASLRSRVARQLAADTNLAFQAYYDQTHRRHENSFEETLRTFDLDAQLSYKPWTGHLLVLGGGYRYSRDDVTNSAAQAFIPEDRSLAWANAFAQDEVALGGGVSATLGLKVERNPYTGSEWLPNLRLAWLHDNDTLVWGALSRAVRAPSRIDREVFVPGAPPYFLTGANVFESEIANVAELGYRTQASAALSFSATAYHHRYPNLRSVGLVDGRAAFRNDIEGHTSGLEAWGTYRLSTTLRVTGGIVAQDISLNVKPGAIDLGGLATLGNSPERMAQLRVSWSPRADVDFDLFTRYVGKLQTVVPAYTATDLRLAWRPSRPLEVSVTVRNAFDPAHIEWQNRGLVERSFFINLRWQG